MALTAASSNGVELGYIAEVTFGTTPTTPTYQLIRYTGESLNFNITNTTSNEIRADRMTADTIQTSADVSGGVNIELSYGSYDTLLEAALCSATWSTPASTISHNAATNNLTVAVAGSNFTITAASGTPFSTFVGVVLVGDYLKINGLTAPNDGYKWVKVAAAPTNTVLTVTGVTLTAGSTTTGTVTFKPSARIKNGTTQRSFTFFKGLSDLKNPTNYPQFTFPGCRINNLNLSFATGSILTGSLDVMGLSATVATTAAPTFTSASTSTVMNAVGNITNIFIDDVASTAYFNKLDFNYTNAIRSQDAIGTLGHVGLALGKVGVTGNIDIYFSDTSLYAKYLAGTAFSLSFMVKDTNTTTDGNAYIITIPRVKFTSATVVASGSDADVNISAQWQALVDATGTYMVRIDKIATG